MVSLLGLLVFLNDFLTAVSTAFVSAVLILVGCGIGTYFYGPDFPLWPFLWDNYLQVLTANLLIAVAISVFVYLRSFTVPVSAKANSTHRELAPGGHSGNI